MMDWQEVAMDGETHLKRIYRVYARRKPESQE